jgi:hypothetical protein
VAVSVLGFTKCTAVAAVVPKRTVAPLVKLAPLMVTEVPPASFPALGETEVTVG